MGSFAEDIEWQEDRRPDDWKGSCVALILTMAKLERVHGGGIDPERKGNNVLHWQQLGDCRFWLSAYAVDPDGDRFKMSPDGNGARDKV
ncbi:MAG: hypothetical protein OXH09_22175, partial [Gammaproteobacteria bacterium]|nr:hypothetical protein [Gammaproteobacteria bacterium]